MISRASVLLLTLAIAVSAFGEKFLSVSDVHFNPFYDPTLMAKLESSPASEWKAIFDSSSVTAFSSYGVDINDPLFRSAMSAMREQLPKPAFVLISGDFLAHSFEKTYQQYATDKSQAAYTAFVAKTIQYVATTFRDAFPHTRIYPTLGNNDSDCGDYAIAPNGAFLKNFQETWSPIVRSSSFDRRFPTGGYYHADVPGLDNVRVISLNTVFFSTSYQNPCGTPGGGNAALRELAWLDAELMLAKSEGKRVWLLYHIPPGMNVYNTVEDGKCPDLTGQSFWSPNYTEPFLGITNKHSATIAGSFAGHTHQDEFRLATGDFIHITPSITPIFGNNPAFEIVETRSNGVINDYTAFHLPNVTLPWQREYSFDAAYGKRRYDTFALADLEQAIGSDEKTRTQYFTYNSSGNAKTTAEALSLWRGYWCGLTALNEPAFEQCYCAAPK